MKTPFAVLALCFAVSPVRADVQILGSPELGSFLSIQDAIDLAPNGATLILGQGDLEAFSIQGKSLTLIQIGAGPAVIQGTSSVVALLPGQSVVLRGLHLAGEESLEQAGASLELTDNAGKVRIDDCLLMGGVGLGGGSEGQRWGNGGAGLLMRNCADVALSNCVVVGGPGGSGGAFEGVGGNGGTALESIDSKVALYRSDCSGGAGGSSGTVGGHGGTGYSLLDGTLFAAGSEFAGGNGGNANDFLAAYGGDGGDGLFATGPSDVTLLDNAYSAGSRGFGMVRGMDGRPRFWEGGPLPQLPGVHRSLSVLTPTVAEGTEWSLRLEGQPGDEVFIALSPGHGSTWSEDPVGVWLVPFPAKMPSEPNGVVQASGDLILTLPTPALQGRPGQRYTAQAFVRNGGSAEPLSNSVQLFSLGGATHSDCDASGMIDLLEIAVGLLDDCDGNLEADSCQNGPDCNGNGVPDGIDIECFGVTDSNDDGIPDTCQVDQTLYVDVGARAGGDGSVAAPFDTLGDAFQFALGSATIVVMPGTYTGPKNRDLNFGDRGLRVVSQAGLGSVILDGQGEGRLFLQLGSLPLPTVRLEGLLIRNGWSQSDGGGIFLQGSGAFVDCTFESCAASNNGGAISGQIQALRCVFDGNQAGSLGGAIRGEGTLSHCVFRSNRATSGGAIAGIGIVSGPVGELDLNNCFFALNEATFGGGAIWSNVEGELAISSSTFVKNVAPQGAALRQFGSLAQISNSVLWNHVTPSLVLQASPKDLLRISYSAIQGGQQGITVTSGNLDYGPGNIETDPLFNNPTVGDYRLGPGSPCLDAGAVGLLSADLLDIDGDFDFGELVPLDLLLNLRRVDDAAPDTGAGSVPLPDMGAFERG